jgi:DNA repair exonuclease SbcCD ATPase subunit
MIPKRILLENFLSFGSPETEIRFADDEPLWVLGGPNGVGKSAVFDAMTYALYGEHRGGASDHASLVRHGANGFRVVFEFEFNGVNYQIARNRPLTGRPTHSIKQWADDGWNKTVQLPSVSSRQDPIKLWTERTLGVGFAAFKASVLLRQGEADAIITAGGSERLNILKKIIGLEAFERLSESIHAQTRRRKDGLDNLKTRRDAMTKVTDEEVAAAQGELVQREDERSRAQEKIALAAARIQLAKQWTHLDAELRTLNHQIRAAADRERDSDRIRRDFLRATDLTNAVPLFRQIVKLRKEMATTNKKLGDCQPEIKRAEDSVRAKELRDEIRQNRTALETADAIKKLRDDLDKFPPDLATQLKAAKELVVNSADVLTATVKDKAGASGLLEEAKKKQRAFAKVGVGVLCSVCGQKVTEKHAKTERDRLTDETNGLQARVEELTKMELQEKANNNNAIEEHGRLDQLSRDRYTKAGFLADKEQMFRGLGIDATPDELRQQILDASAELARLEAEVGDQSRANLAALKKNLASLEANVQTYGRTLASLQGQESNAVTQLSSKWNGQVEKVDERSVTAFEAELQTLVGGGITELHRQLEHDATLRDGRTTRLSEVNRLIDEIPADSKVQVADAERQLSAVKEAAGAAASARDTAKKKVDDLTGEIDRFRKMVDEINIAERTTDLHRKLDELLGKAGIQRELVRSAERDIVRMANDTVQNLSDGDLTVELESGADGDDQAFSLQVRRADGPTPIGVNYLSGSQKFRVAIAVALAIGRFAAGQARPLESVIIDEGFGSLDKDGLRAAATELNRLRQHLRRIVLVSHQEDFADQFPVVIRLAAGENGTVATAVRK